MIPFLPLNFEVAADSAWRLSCLLFVVASQIASFRMTQRYQRSGLEVPLSVKVFVVTLSGGADLLLLTNALGLYGSAAFPVYLTGLFANLGLAGFYFMLVVGSVFSVDDEAGA